MAERDFVTVDYRPSAGFAVAAIRSTNAPASGAPRKVLDLRTGTAIAAWRIPDGERLRVLERPATVVALAPDGSCLGVGGPDGRVTVYSLPDLAEVFTQKFETTPVRCLAFQRDVRVRATDVDQRFPWLVAAGFQGGRIALFDLPDRMVRMVFTGGAYDTLSLVFLRDGQTLASGGRQELRFWDVATGRELLRTAEGLDYALALAVSPDGRFLAGASKAAWVPASVAVYELELGRGVQALRGLSGPSSRVAFSPSGALLAALGHNWELAIWSLPAGRLERLLETPQGLTADNASFAFSPDEERLLFATARQAVVWEWRSGKLLAQWSLPLGLGHAVWFDAEERMFVFQWDSASQEGIVQPGPCTLRELVVSGEVRPVWSKQVFGGRSLSARIVDGGRKVAVAGQFMTDRVTNGVFVIYDTSTGNEYFSIPRTNPFDPEYFPVNDTASLAAASDDAMHTNWTIFRVPSGEEAWRTRLVLSAIAPNSQWLSCSTAHSRGMEVIPWGEAHRRLDVGVEDRITHSWSVFSPDSRRVARGMSSGTVLVLDIEEGYRRLEAWDFGW